MCAKCAGGDVVVVVECAKCAGLLGVREVRRVSVKNVSAGGAKEYL